jgi:hypothetical protein
MFEPKVLAIAKLPVQIVTRTANRQLVRRLEGPIEAQFVSSVVADLKANLCADCQFSMMSVPSTFWLAHTPMGAVVLWPQLRRGCGSYPEYIHRVKEVYDRKFTPAPMQRLPTLNQDLCRPRKSYLLSQGTDSDYNYLPIDA